MLPPMPIARYPRRSTVAIGLLLSVSCSPESEPPQSVHPAARSDALPEAEVDDATELAAPAAVDGREGSGQQPTPPSDPPTERPLVSESLAERMRELQASVREFRELPLEKRTENLRDIYQHELLELGRTLASIRPNDPGLRSFYTGQAVTAFEELAFESGEDSDLGVRAYQCLADLKREAGLLDEAADYEEALQRLLDERDD